MGFDEFLLLRMKSTVSERTCKREIEILRRFIRYLTGKEPLRFKLLWNQTDDFAPNRKFIDSGQWEKLVDGVPARTRLILYLGAGMGLRRAEIAKIKLTDIDGRFLTVHGKGHGPEGKVVRLEMPAPVIDAIVDWLPERLEFIRKWGDNSDGYLLINQWRGKGTPMTPGKVGDVVRRLGRERGIEFTAHSLRRLYASTIHKSGVEMDTLRRMMRHVNVQTTLSCYVNADPDRMNAARDLVSSALLGAAKACDRNPKTMDFTRFPSEKPFPLSFFRFRTSGFFYSRHFHYQFARIVRQSAENGGCQSDRANYGHGLGDAS